jgi:hypothetical protein
MTFRECLQCGEEISGRADKIFCSPSCKSVHFRAQQTERPAAPVPAARPLPLPLPELPEPVPEEALTADEFSRLVAEEVREVIRNREDNSLAGLRQEEKKDELKQRSKLIIKLFKLYRKLVAKFLDVEGIEFEYEEEISDLLNELDEAAALYRAHPLLKMPGHPAGQRLENIYFMQDKVRKVEINDLDCFSLTKKERKQLREALLGDE